MKTVAVYFAAYDRAGPPSGKPDYVEAYGVFARAVAAKGGKLIVTRDASTYLGGNRFSKHWEFTDGAWMERGECEADVIFVKDRDLPRDASSNVVNSWELEELCNDKDKTPKIFGDLFPKTVLVGSEAELDPAMHLIEGNMIVAKPVDGAGGRGVYVGLKSAMDRSVLAYPLLLQEFLDMSGGIPGLCGGPHDLRVVIVGGNVALCTVRTPADGSLVANAAQGGTVMLVPREKIPSEALALALRVDARLQTYPERVYSVDMGLHRGSEWKVIELNSPPGLTPPKWGPLVMDYYDLLAEHLVTMAR